MNEFNRVFGAVTGAADLVMDMHAGAQRVAAGKLAMARTAQLMRFDEQLMPLKLRLLDEQIAGAKADRLARGYSMWQATQAEARRNRVEIESERALGDLWGDYSAWKGGRAAMGAGVAPLDDAVLGEFYAPTPGVDAGGAIDDGLGGVRLGGVRPGGEATGGGLLPDAMLDGYVEPAAGEPPFSAEDGLIEGEGDGASIAEREIAAQARKAAHPGIAEREVAAQRAKSSAPRSAMLLERLKMTVQGFGGLAKIAERKPHLIPQIAEMATVLAGDPQMRQWKLEQERRAKQQVARDAVLGQIASAGLRTDEFSDVLGAIEAGLPVDPGVIGKRIESGYKLREEAAKLAIGGDAMLRGLTASPVYGQMASAGIGLFARAGEKGTRMAAAYGDMLQRGDLAGARALLRGAALDLAPTAVQNEFAAAGKMQDAIADVRTGLTEFYSKYGDATGPIAGRSLSTVTESVEINALKTRLAAARQQFMAALSGANIPEPEMRRYEKMFPDEKKGRTDNMAQLAELETSLANRRQSSERAVMGDLYPLVTGSPTAATPRPGVSGIYNTPEELNAAIARGEIGENDTVLYQGQMIRMKKGAGK